MYVLVVITLLVTAGGGGNLSQSHISKHVTFQEFSSELSCIDMQKFLTQLDILMTSCRKK